jgi:hypothetical protein
LGDRVLVASEHGVLTLERFVPLALEFGPRQKNARRFSVTGPPDWPVWVQRNTDLAAWEDWQRVTTRGDTPIQLSDHEVASRHSGFTVPWHREPSHFTGCLVRSKTDSFCRRVAWLRRRRRKRGLKPGLRATVTSAQQFMRKEEASKPVTDTRRDPAWNFRTPTLTSAVGCSAARVSACLRLPGPHEAAGTIRRRHERCGAMADLQTRSLVVACSGPRLIIRS